MNQSFKEFWRKFHLAEGLLEKEQSDLRWVYSSWSSDKDQRAFSPNKKNEKWIYIFIGPMSQLDCKVLTKGYLNQFFCSKTLRLVGATIENENIVHISYN